MVDQTSQAQNLSISEAWSLSIQMSSSKIGQLPSHTDTSIKEFMSNHPETITMETEAPVSYKPMSEVSQG